MKLIKEIIRQHLSESRKGSDVLILNFNSTMNPEGSEYQLYMDVLQTVYPNLEWANGVSINDFTPSKPIAQLLVGHNHTNKLMWNSAWSEPGGIDAREWLAKTQGFSTEDMFGSLYESEDLEWAQELFTETPVIPKVDGQRRVIRKGGTTLTNVYINYILNLLNNNGYSRGDLIFLNDNMDRVINALNKGGYIILRSDGRVSYGSDENTLVKTNNLKYNDVPNVFI